MMQEIIRLDHISKTFDNVCVLKDIHATLRKGEILGFLGPSGAGKTTTIKILTGQLFPSSGDAYILGINANQIDETIYEQIGIVTDSSGIYEYLSVEKNLEYFAKILKVEKQRVEDVLHQVGLYEHRKKLAGKLSKGQIQRLILARAVLHKPQVLFLDEPTSGLDPSTALQIHNMLFQLKEEGMAIFLTTHNMEEATKLCDHVALLNEGHIVLYGNPKALCCQYDHLKTITIQTKDHQKIELPNTANSAQQLSDVLRRNNIETIHSSEANLEQIFREVTGRGLS